MYEWRQLQPGVTCPHDDSRGTMSDLQRLSMCNLEPATMADLALLEWDLERAIKCSRVTGQTISKARVRPSLLVH